MKASYRFFPANVLLASCLVLAVVLAGCATPRQGPPLPAVTLGVTGFSQPHSASEMLAGHMPEDAPRVTEKQLAELDEAFLRVLSSRTDRTFADPETYFECRNATPDGMPGNRIGALKRWVAIGNCMRVDFLIVPQIYHLQDREGGRAGVTRPASVVMDIFLIDVKNAGLASRSHFNETQTALADNLLNTRQFFARGASWITAVQLASEGMEKAVRDLGL